jgi:CRISPR-associated endonuclease Csn1
MEKIIGIDLGSNSIGWAIRDVSVSKNQITDKGVLTFDKGVGEDKGVEIPMVKKRTESRGKRRNYQAEKYRKWELLKFLIERNLCPLTIDELNLWKHYSIGKGRVYPQSEKFLQWLRFDFDGDLKPDFHLFNAEPGESHYIFRVKAISENEEDRSVFIKNPHILGRIFYQLVQRRGYRGRDDDAEEAKTILKGSEKSGTQGHDDIAPYIETYKTLGSALYHIQKDKRGRIRKRYNLRTDYEQELKEICRIQKITEDDYSRLWKAIIWQRPLRSQKGLVGICTFEKNKSRCPISHPVYEEYKTWVFINNLNIELPDKVDKIKYLHDEIYPLFYNASKDFKLTTILKKLQKVGGTFKSKFSYDTKVISCNLLNSFEKILGKNWKEDFGWNDILQNKPKSCNYSIDDIWHVLFSFDSKEKLKEFALLKLKLDEESAKKFSKINLPKGYATLSLSAIKKILRYLQKDFIYSEAVYLANMHKVICNNEITLEVAQELTNTISEIIKEHRTKIETNIVINRLISDQLNSEYRFGMDKDYQLDNEDKRDISNKIIEVFGSKTWSEKINAEKRNLIYQNVEKEYLSFLRKPINTKKETMFVKTSRLHDKIFEGLRKSYNIPSENIKYLWHPSEQETYTDAAVYQKVIQQGKELYIPIEKVDEFIKKYPNAQKYGFTIKLLGDPRPISKGFKNPMALRTMHELKKLMNYLLKSGKIDENTHVVIEIARELNDANMRKAIETWQRQREKENDAFKEKIREIAEANPKMIINPEDSKIIAKYRLWMEQNQRCLYTGKTINCTDLFDGSRFNFEHTIPASMSFDNELKNLTIAEIDYNINIKGKHLPSECPNYENDAIINGKEYSSIKPRLKFIEVKVENLEKLLEEWKIKTRFASSKEIKDACILRRHLIKFELDYWRKKLDTFTCKEYKSGWRNSQLKDTQVITKYALPFLKTIFNRVEVQKGSITASFREIYKIQPKVEKKDREKHSHHAIDAAVLTLIPPASIRDQILMRYNELKDNDSNENYHERVINWDGFNANYILSIHNDVLINYQPKSNTLIPAIKKIRKRGIQQYVKFKDTDGKLNYKVDEEGKKIPLIAQGDSIRGQLHKDGLFGVVKIEDQLCLVERYPVSSFTSLHDCKKIVDKAVRGIVRSELEKRMESGKTFDQAKQEPIPFPTGKAFIKKVRCKVPVGRGYLTLQKAIPIRKHTFLSTNNEYKHFVYAQNEENTLCLYYEKTIDNKTIRAFKLVGLHELAKLKLKRIEDIRYENNYRAILVGRGKIKREIPMDEIIKVGTKVIFYTDNILELKNMSKQDLLKRIYRVYKFNEMGSPFIYLQNHLEARSNEKLGNGDNSFDPNKYQSRLCLVANSFICAIEGKNFEISPAGEIIFK